MSDSGNSGTISELSWHWSKKLSHVFCRRWQKVVRFHVLCWYFRNACFFSPWFWTHIEKLGKFHKILRQSVYMELKVTGHKIHIQ